MPSTTQGFGCLHCCWLEAPEILEKAGAQLYTPGHEDTACPALRRPVAIFTQLVQAKLTMCKQLEDIADNLPHSVNRWACERISDRLFGLLKLCDDISKAVIFPLLLRRQAESLFTPSTVKRLAEERAMDQGYAWEVCDLLRRLARGEPVENAEASGYLLRSVFETVKRSSAHDLEYIIPFAERYMLNKEKEQLSTVIKPVSYTHLTLPTTSRV